jgi:adenosine kinase
MGAAGVRVVGTDQETVEVPAVPGVHALEPTGVGDAFRSGFLAALEWQLTHERAAQVGCVLAAYVVEQVGTQEYSFTHAQFVDRLAAAYGEEAAADVRPHLS